MMRLCTVLIFLAVLVGCAAHTTGVYNAPPESEREPQRAHTLTLEAADLIASDPSRADALLREALTADLYHGPAHNNLGVVYLSQGKLYEAAHEFEWAQRLMPGHPDPRVNLALTLERAGRTDEALAEYEAALEAYAEHVPATQGLVRLQARMGRSDDRTAARLALIALRGETEGWRQWAQAQLALQAR